MNQETMTDFSLEELKEELEREETKEKAVFSVRKTVSTLLITAAAVVLLTTFVFPILRINGSSMEPTLKEDDVVLALKTTDIQKNDKVAFYYNNKVIVKRVIALPGDIVSIQNDGTVSVNGETLDEPYVYEKALGECNISFPYTVPEGRIFVMGDHRSVSIDSRTSAIGCIPKERILGKTVFCIWPLGDIGLIN